MPFITWKSKRANLTPEDEAYNWSKTLHVEDGGGFLDSVPLTFGNELDAALKWDGTNLSLALASGKFQVGGGLQLWDGAAWQDVPHKGASTITGKWTFTAVGDPGGALNLVSTLPQILFTETDTAASGRNYWFRHQGGAFYCLQDRTGGGAWTSPHPWWVTAEGRLNIGVGAYLASTAPIDLNAGKTQIYNDGYFKLVSTTSNFLYNQFSTLLRCQAAATNQYLYLDHESAAYASYIQSRCNVAGSAINLWFMGCGAGGALVIQGQAPGVANYWRVRDAANTANLDGLTITVTNTYLGYAGTNVLRTAATGADVYDGSAWQAVVHAGRFLEASQSYNPPSIGPGVSTPTTIGVTGAVVGDYIVGISHSQDGAAGMNDLTWSGKVTAPGVVTVWLTNNSTSNTRDMADGVLYVRVLKRA